tara:strand:- start:202 stop:417 length:216 start_codon:yes stop_codon:yes gene_type:complete
MKKNTTKKSIPYSEEALKYFQKTNDNTEFMTEFNGNFDYMSYLLGDDVAISGSFEDDVMEYEESDDEWYMD